MSRAWILNVWILSVASSLLLRFRLLIFLIGELAQQMFPAAGCEIPRDAICLCVPQYN
jgi:hypothetical protein